MSEGVCRQFVPHAWKSDVCANCQRPRLKHVDNADVSVCLESEHGSASPAAVSKHVSTHLSDSPHRSPTGAVKPSPVKAKPAVSAKPEKPKKPCLVGDQTSGKSDSKPCGERVVTDHLPLSKSKNAVSNDSSINASQITHAAGTHTEEEKKMHLNDDMDHHYDVYDVTARGLSGTPGQLEVDNGTNGGDKVVDQRLESECRKFGTLPVTAMRDDEVAEEHVAMPYNVVDVTIRRPHASNITTRTSDTVSTGTWPTKPQPTKRQAVAKSPPKPRERLSKSKERASPSNVEVSGRQELDGCADTHAVDRKLVESDSELVSERYAHRIYEDIEDLDVDQFSPKTAVRSSVKSAAFEAKIAALASLDFGKTAKLTTAVAPAASPPVEESSPVKTDIASVQDAVVVPATKPEKARKGGGKSFFQKFLKFGSKDASETTRSSTSSDESSSRVVQNPGTDSPSSGRTDASNDDNFSPDVVPSQAVPLSEKQVMLMNLKDCLAKRQTSIGSDSSEISPAHLRTRSESTPVQSSVASVGSIQSARGNNLEENEKRGIIAGETLPPVHDSQPSPPIHVQPASANVSLSSPPHPGEESSENVKTLQTVDKRGKEMQRLEVAVAPEDSGNVDCSVSTCSSDAVSPTPSDLSVEGGDHHSLKRKSRTDRQGNRLCMPLVVFYCTQLQARYDCFYYCAAWNADEV